MERLDADDEITIKNFTSNYMQVDGIFVMFILEHNTDIITAGKFVASLWDSYRSKAMLDFDTDTDSWLPTAQNLIESVWV